MRSTRKEDGMVRGAAGGAVCRRVATVAFWDGYARWYKLWLEHNNYHAPIIEFLKHTVEPGWKVLDIGAGSGVLSLPLAEMGCEVTAIEPSISMRRLLFEEMFRRGTDAIDVEERRWEDMPMAELPGYDLILACNTLHLTTMGLTGRWRRSSRPIRTMCLSSPSMSLARSSASPTLRMCWAAREPTRPTVLSDIMTWMKSWNTIGSRRGQASLATKTWP